MRVKIYIIFYFKISLIWHVAYSRFWRNLKDNWFISLTWLIIFSLDYYSWIETCILSVLQGIGISVFYFKHEKSCFILSKFLWIIEILILYVPCRCEQVLLLMFEWFGCTWWWWKFCFMLRWRFVSTSLTSLTAVT